MDNFFSVFRTPRQLKPQGVAAFVFLELCRRATIGGGLRVRVSIPELAEELGTDERSMRIQVRRLSMLGWIVEHRQPGAPTIYEIKFEASGPGTSGPDGGGRPEPAATTDSALAEGGLIPEVVVPPDHSCAPGTSLGYTLCKNTLLETEAIVAGSSLPLIADFGPHGLRSRP
jgi:hypothetical protein